MTRLFSLRSSKVHGPEPGSKLPTSCQTLSVFGTEPFCDLLVGAHLSRGCTLFKRGHHNAADVVAKQATFNGEMGRLTVAPFKKAHNELSHGEPSRLQRIYIQSLPCKHLENYIIQQVSRSYISRTACACTEFRDFLDGTERHQAHRRLQASFQILTKHSTTDREPGKPSKSPPNLPANKA